MAVFWPESSPEASRNSLNVAIHGLRRTLRTITDMPVVVYAGGAYRINCDDLRLWLDVDEFDSRVEPMAKPFEHLRTLLANDLPKAATQLAQVVKTLDAYAAVRPATPAATDSSEPDGVSPSPSSEISNLKSQISEEGEGQKSFGGSS